MRLGVSVQWLALGQLLLGDEKLAAEAARSIKYDGLGPLYRGVLAWRHGDAQGALEILRPIRPRRDPSFRGLLDYWLARAAFDARYDAEGIASVTEFERDAPVGVWRGWALAELLLLKAQAHERLGEHDQAIATVDRLLAGWKRADADLPRLAEAKALRVHLGASAWVPGRPPASAAPPERR